MSGDTEQTGTQLGAEDSLVAIAAAVTDGQGVPALVRAASRGLGSSILLLDRAGLIVAVAARSTAEERALVDNGKDVDHREIELAGHVVGHLRLRGRGEQLDQGLLALVTALLALELERIKAPIQASRDAADRFLQAILTRELRDADDILARGAELGVELSSGGAALVARAHHSSPTDGDWRQRLLSLAERGIATTAPGGIATLVERAHDRGVEVVLLLPGVDSDALTRAADAALRELSEHMTGFTFVVGRSRVATTAADISRACDEARLAANVAEASGDTEMLGFEETGAYRLLLSAMSEDPEELERFYKETLQPVVAYDDQYETDLMLTLETFLDANGSVAGTAQALFTHRHTVRYRLERVKEITELDVASTDGREKLSLGLKAMRVLGIPYRRGTAADLSKRS